MATKYIPPPPKSDLSPAMTGAGIMLFAWGLAWFFGYQLGESYVKRTTSKDALFDSGPEIPFRYNKMLEKAPGGIAGLLIAVFGAIACLSFEERPVGIEFGLGIVVNGIIQIIGGFHTGYFLRLFWAWWNLEKFTMHFEVLNGQQYRVRTKYGKYEANRETRTFEFVEKRAADIDTLSRSERVQEEHTYRQKMAENHTEALKMLLFLGGTWLVLVLVGEWFIESISREDSALPIIVPFVLAQCFLAYPLGKWLAAMLDGWAHDRGYQYLPGAKVLDDVIYQPTVEGVTGAKPLGDAQIYDPTDPPQTPRPAPTPAAGKIHNPFG